MHRLAFELDQIVHGVPALFFRERARTDSEGEDRRYQLLQLDDARHVLAESYRNIRSSIFFMPYKGSRLKTILITSSVPNEGEIDHRFQSGHHHGAFRRPHTPDR